MRTAYCKTLYEIMSRDSRVYALTADIGFRNFDEIMAEFPDRFVNVGVAEANMIGIAAGLALSGKIPFAFTIAPFVTMRCFEQIRVDLCYQQLPVKIIGAGGGFVYGSQGTTHHAIEELGILRTLPGMTVLCPADPVETEKTVMETMRLAGPSYIRIGRNNEPIVTDKDYPFRIGKAVTLKKGNDISIVTCGLAAHNCLAAADILVREGIHASVINMHTIKPVDKEAILRCADETGCIVTVEEHNIIGGLGSAVAEVIAEEIHHPISFKRIGLNDVYLRMHGSYDDLKNEFGLGIHGIATAVRKFLRKDV